MQIVMSSIESLRRDGLGIEALNLAYTHRPVVIITPVSAFGMSETDAEFAAAAAGQFKDEPEVVEDEESITVSVSGPISVGGVMTFETIEEIDGRLWAHAPGIDESGLDADLLALMKPIRPEYIELTPETMIALAPEEDTET